MAWNRLSISRKLFVAIVTTTGVIVLAMALLLAFTIREGFSQFLLASELDRFDDLAAELAELYDAQSGGWPMLQGDHLAWRALTRQELAPARVPPGQLSPTGRSAGRPPPGRGRRGPPGPPDPLQLGQRLGLTDTAGHLIAGANNDGASSARRPVRSGDGNNPSEIVGYLVLAAPESGALAADSVFLAKQLRMLTIAACLAVVLSGSSAFLLARQFAAPVNALVAGTRRLAGGEYDLRMETDREDEFGRLIESFNQLAAHLAESERVERQWLSDTSHELKTPLAILRAEIEAVQDGVRKPDATTLANLHAAVLRLSDLVQDISSLSLSRENRLVTDLVPVNISDCVTAAADANRTALSEAGLELECHIEPGLWLTCDRRRIDQLLQNLLSNARNYTSQPGLVRVSLTREAESAQLVVEDTAPCPPERSRERLFDRFYRAEGSRSRAHGGSGLGLAICRAIVAAHGGTIEADQSSLRGLQVKISLPNVEEVS